MSRYTQWACLAIGGADRTQYEIRMERAHVGALGDHLPGVLAGLDRWTAEEQARAFAESPASAPPIWSRRHWTKRWQPGGGRP